MYALLESESRLAAAAVGLDPGIGVLHVDTDARDSLACDLMEPARPHVDAYLLKWITEGPLRREWFFEQRDGNCRLMINGLIRQAAFRKSKVTVLRHRRTVLRRGGETLPLAGLGCHRASQLGLTRSAIVRKFVPR